MFIYAILNPFEIGTVANTYALTGAYFLIAVLLGIVTIGFASAVLESIWHTMKSIFAGYIGYNDGERRTGNDTMTM